MFSKILWHEDANGGCHHHHHDEITPSPDRTQAMLNYMIHHNEQHASEIRESENGVSPEAAACMEEAVKAVEMSCDSLRDALTILQREASAKATEEK